MKALFVFMLGEPTPTFVTSLRSEKDKADAEVLSGKIIGNAYFEIMPTVETVYYDMHEPLEQTFRSERNGQLYVKDRGFLNFKPKTDD